jgi:hypothetical protein
MAKVKGKKKASKQLMGIKVPKAIRNAPVIGGLMRTPSGRALLMVGLGAGAVYAVRNRGKLANAGLIGVDAAGYAGTAATNTTAQLVSSLGSIVTGVAREALETVGGNPELRNMARHFLETSAEPPNRSASTRTAKAPPTARKNNRTRPTEAPPAQH